MLHALGHNEQLPWAQFHICVTQLDSESAIDDQEEFIGFFMAMPHQLALDFDDLYVIIVDVRDCFRGPLVGKLCELCDEINRFESHDFKVPFTSVLAIPAPRTHL